MKSSKDSLRDRMKQYEMAEAGRRAMPGLPVIARLDGRAFHTFTRGLDRPFSRNMSEAMRLTMEALVEEFHCQVGYTQSDEITLVWREPCLFDGRFQKLHSVLAGYASATFAQVVPLLLPSKAQLVPCFDCRVFQVPTLGEALNCLIWRERDATKNAIQMAAQAVCSHKALQGLNGSQQQEAMFQKGVNFNDYPARFRRGLWAQRKKVERHLTADELAGIPEDRRPTGPVIRTVMESFTLDEPLTWSQDNLDRLFGKEES